MKKLKARTGGKRDDTCDHGLSRSWKVDVCEKKRDSIRTVLGQDRTLYAKQIVRIAG